MNTNQWLTLALLSCSLNAFAELSLNIEDLITDKGKYKLDLSLNYANTERQGVTASEPIIIQTGPASFITLPTQIGETQSNTDTFVSTLGLRYGFTHNTEFLTRASFIHNNARHSTPAGPSNNSENRFADAWLGINTQFKKDNDNPALLGFVEVALYERHKTNHAAFKSWLFGLTTYHAIDPIVLSLTLAYRFNQTRQDNNINYKPGNLLLINPQLAFAVNDRVTLTSGMQWTHHQADTNHQQQTWQRTSTDLLIGMGFGLSKESTMNFTVKTNISGRSGADLRLSWLHTF